MTARAISGTRRTFKELVDGTLRVQIDIDPEHRRDFLRLFPEIDTRVAIAPLVAVPPPPKGGELAKLAGMFCGDPNFQLWIEERCDDVPASAAGEGGEERAAAIVRHMCGVASRAELDSNPKAAIAFHEQIRKPWAESHG